MAGSKIASQRKRLRAALALVLVGVLGAATAVIARADPPPPAAAEAATALPDRARAVLEAHCVECRDAHGSGGTVDLASLAESALVVAGRPDASPIYQRLLAVQRLNGGEAAPAPSPADVETVRDWIESLPAPDAACRDRKLVSNGDAAALIAGWSEGRSAADKMDTRVLSLLHLWNACIPQARLDASRDAVSILLAALARGREPVEVETLGDTGTLFVVRLSGLGLDPAAWVRLMTTAPRIASADAVPADWLAAHLLSRSTDEAANADPGVDVKFDAASLLAIESLARLWTRDVDLLRAAAERGVAQRALAEQVALVGGEFLHPARRLLHGSVTRPAWESLSRALDGEARPGSARNGAAPSETWIDVLLWTDKPFYRPRDLVTFNVSVDRACHLTLIDIDRDGKAIVLFPNELEPDNLIAPGVNVRIPGNGTGYQLRFDRSGEEGIVAICQRKSRRPPGISYDYERQRFAILGDWRTFLRTMPEREKQIRAREEAGDARRKRRGRRPAANGLPAIDPDGPPVEGRAAITVTIDPGGT